MKWVALWARYNLWKKLKKKNSCEINWVSCVLGIKMSESSFFFWIIWVSCDLSRLYLEVKNLVLVAENMSDIDEWY